MTKAELEVERDWLLEHGRTLEEVEAMQVAPTMRLVLESMKKTLLYEAHGQGGGDWRHVRNCLHYLGGYGDDLSDLSLLYELVKTALTRRALPPLSSAESAAGASTPVQREGRR